MTFKIEEISHFTYMSDQGAALSKEDLEEATIALDLGYANHRDQFRRIALSFEEFRLRQHN